VAPISGHREHQEVDAAPTVDEAKHHRADGQAAGEGSPRAQSGLEGTDGRTSARQAAIEWIEAEIGSWLRPELRARVQHLKAKGTLRHATVKQLITD
jgi:hypothetical protein